MPCHFLDTSRRNKQKKTKKEEKMEKSGDSDDSSDSDIAGTDSEQSRQSFGALIPPHTHTHTHTHTRQWQYRDMVTVVSSDSGKQWRVVSGDRWRWCHEETLNRRKQRKISELPPHKLILKKNATIFLLRNLNPRIGA
jgi:hypothetical protein